MRPWADDRGSAIVEFALVVPLLLGVVLAVLRIGAWFLDMAAATAAAHDAARAVARTGGTVAVARRFLPPGAGATVSTERVGGATAVRVEIPVPVHGFGWELRRSAVAVVTVEPD